MVVKVGDLFPIAAMLVVECCDVGLTSLSKAAMKRGMSHFVFVAYSNILAALIILPSSFIFHWSLSNFFWRGRPILTFSFLCRMFVLGSVGIAAPQTFVFTGVSYSSPTLASAMSNLIPAFTFILAILFRMESLDLTKWNSLAKFLGTLISILGAFVVIFYKGPYLKSSESRDDWVLGSLFLFGAGASVSTWNILQAATVKKYPSEVFITSFSCLFAAMQTTLVALVAEPNRSAWELRPDLELISVAYSAIMGNIFTYTVQTWCIKKKGPLFAAIFKPLTIAIAAVMGVIFLAETLHLGSLTGGAIIAMGFYTVLWGESTEQHPVHGDGARPLLEAANDGARS